MYSIVCHRPGVVVVVAMITLGVDPTVVGIMC